MCQPNQKQANIDMRQPESLVGLNVRVISLGKVHSGIVEEYDPKHIIDKTYRIGDKWFNLRDGFSTNGERYTPSRGIRWGSPHEPLNMNTYNRRLYKVRTLLEETEIDHIMFIVNDFMYDYVPYGKVIVHVFDMDTLSAIGNELLDVLIRRVRVVELFFTTYIPEFVYKIPVERLDIRYPENESKWLWDYHTPVFTQTLLHIEVGGIPTPSWIQQCKQLVSFQKMRYWPGCLTYLYGLESLYFVRFNFYFDHRTVDPRDLAKLLRVGKFLAYQDIRDEVISYLNQPKPKKK